MRVRTHPGEILRHEYLNPLDMSATGLAERIGVPANRITEIVRGRRDMTADTALRLGEFFDTTPEFWMNLQTAHDLSKALLERSNVRTIGSPVCRSSKQKGWDEQTSVKVAASAARVLKNPKKALTSDKALAASALTQKSGEMQGKMKLAKGRRKP